MQTFVSSFIVFAEVFVKRASPPQERDETLR